MKFTRSLIFLAALCCPFFWPVGAAAAAGQKAPPRPYKIYCVGGVVLVENRTAQEIEREKKARPCLLTRTEFTNLYTARRAAKRFGGAGSPCRCPDAPTAN